MGPRAFFGYSATSDVLASGVAGETESAEVISVTSAPCPPPQEGTCMTVQAEITSGVDDGAEVTFPTFSGPLTPDLESGDKIRVSSAGAPPEPAGAEAEPVYNLTDIERRAPMLWLALAFAALVIAFGRLRGALSLVGLAASLAVVVVS